MGRQDLLADAVAYGRAHGLAGTTLRQLADAIGTSHRMLLYHFGSREGLLAAVVAEVEASERRAATALAADAPDADEVLRRGWERLRAPDRAGEERLFFELTAAAMQGTPGTERLRDELVDPWLADDADPAARHARRVDIAVMRGLLLDVLVTGDGAGVDAAFEHYRALRRGAAPPEKIARSVS
jgi:AcrR family transcriptional regulator